MLFVSCGYFLIIIAVNEVASKFYPILQKYDLDTGKNKYIRHKRQFGNQEFDDNSGFNSDSQNNDFSNDGIFFDDDNMFLDFVRPNRPRDNQNNDFRNDPNVFDRNNRPPPANWPGPFDPTTQTPLGVTSVNIPGMGTTRSACEDRCLTTTQYNPVCGDNQVTYINVERFKCAVRCGRNIQIAAYRACPRIMV